MTIPESDVRVQIQTDKRYGEFVRRASVRSILGMELPVASVDDVLQGKIWAASDSERRGSKRQKDLADIARILECLPSIPFTSAAGNSRALAELKSLFNQIAW